VVGADRWDPVVWLRRRVRTSAIVVALIFAGCWVAAGHPCSDKAEVVAPKTEVAAPLGWEAPPTAGTRSVDDFDAPVFIRRSLGEEAPPTAGTWSADDFNASALARRFLARGNCIHRTFDSSKLVNWNSAHDHDKMSQHGWGNKMRVSVLTFGEAAAARGVPVFPHFGGDLQLTNWFQKMRPGHGRRLEMKSQRVSAVFAAHGCNMRQYLDHPTDELAARLSQTIGKLAPGDLVVALHLRFGDVSIEKALKGGQHRRLGRDDRLGALPHAIQEMRALVDELIRELESHDPQVHVRIFVASDVLEGEKAVRDMWGSRVLDRGTKKIVFHSAGRFQGASEQHRSMTADIVSDWLLLAMSDVLVQPFPSTFSETAMYVGMQGPCRFYYAIWKTRTQHKEACVQGLLGSLKGR